MKIKERKKASFTSTNQIVLILEGLIVGAGAGFVALLYRLLLDKSSVLRNRIITWAKGDFLKIGIWFLLVIVCGYLVYRLVKFEPMISGSGIPQLEGEIQGALEENWKKVLPAKFIGGLLGVFSGLALGREGPSIQLGAMVGKLTGRGLKKDKTREKFLLTCGASAGLSAAFHAPLAGVLFSLEEVHKNFSVSLLIGVMSSSLMADFVSSKVFGLNAVFSFGTIQNIPRSDYLLLILLGLILGLLGVFYNWFTLRVQRLYQEAKAIPEVLRMLFPFMVAGILAFVMPEILGSGHNLIEDLTTKPMALGMVLLILVGRFVFSAVSFGSGVPGGIFFPLLVIGGYIGGAFALLVNPTYISNFVILAMAGYFAAIVRAPLTGIILIFEMTGSLNQMMSLSLVSIVAYVVATMMRSKPIYESLLERLLKRQKKEIDPLHKNAQEEKVLSYYTVELGSKLEGKRISEVNWPKGSLIVSIERGSSELIPNGELHLLVGDFLVVMSGEGDYQNVMEEIGKLASFE
ncbi:MAG TPA: ClC family H(+)/Cl(-) exchange transporter [Candidatus Dorea intestinavium]|nr:ClC family H(+)/Cl(-) exchange transporter [Candidatus Dorea intestinavium]